jgi:hypothetical protein
MVACHACLITDPKAQEMRVTTTAAGGPPGIGRYSWRKMLLFPSPQSILHSLLLFGRNSVI